MSRDVDQIGVMTTHPEGRDQARALADRLELPFLEEGSDEPPLMLAVTPQRLELRQTGSGAPGPIYVDFLSGAVAHRRQYGGGRGQLIARAVGLKTMRHPCVIDATAGLGRDAFILACLGCRVVMLERSPIIAALLEDGLSRLRADPLSEEISLELHQGDANSYMCGLSTDMKPDVVYLDPMFPDRAKSALVKKEMRVLRMLVGVDEDAQKLFNVARECALKRVVVKRARLAPTITPEQPDLVLRGKSSRFDIYF